MHRPRWTPSTRARGMRRPRRSKGLNGGPKACFPLDDLLACMSPILSFPFPSLPSSLLPPPPLPASSWAAVSGLGRNPPRRSCRFPHTFVPLHTLSSQSARQLAWFLSTHHTHTTAGGYVRTEVRLLARGACVRG